MATALEHMNNAKRELEAARTAGLKTKSAVRLNWALTWLQWAREEECKSFMPRSIPGFQQPSCERGCQAD